MDGLPGNAEALKDVFPQADIQECAIHHMRAQTAKVRQKDRKELAQDMRTIFRSESEPETQEKFDRFKEKWNKRYPSVIRSWEQK